MLDHDVMQWMDGPNEKDVCSCLVGLGWSTHQGIKKE